MSADSIIIHIPHSSTYIPDAIRQSMLIDDDALRRNMIAFTDWRTRDIFTHKGFDNRVIYPVSRMVCDPERYRSDRDESMAAIGLGAVYAKDAFLNQLRSCSNLERELMLQLYYDPHHRKLNDMVAQILKRHGHCLIVDAHSFSDTPLPYEPDQAIGRPDICIGTCPEHTPRNLTAKAIRFFQQQGLTVSINAPYSGTMVPSGYWQDQRVKSIMVEINRGLYRKAADFFPSSGYAKIKNMIRDFLIMLSA